MDAISTGDNSALDKLIRLHGPYLKRIIQFRFSPELSSRVDVSDVVQETEMVILRRINEFIDKRPTSFRVWLRSRAIEQLADQHRRHIGAEMRSVRREQKINDSSSMTIARALISETPSKMLRRREVAEQIRDVIDSLNENDREILTLRHVDGLTGVEAAEALNIKPTTARQRYGRALQRFVEKVANAGLDLDVSWGDAR